MQEQLRREGIDGFLVPRADVHQGEYVSARDARLEWLTGFSGSAGFCIATKTEAGVFIDGRYKVQARQQINGVFTAVDWPETTAAAWLNAKFETEATIGFDPWLHTVDQVSTLKNDLTVVEIKPVENLIDRIWDDQPQPANMPFISHALENAGESHQSKRERLAKHLTSDAVIITLPDSIAWLLNIRGSDIPRNPVPQAFAILNKDATVDLFALQGKADQVQEHLGNDVRHHDIGDFVSFVEKMDGKIQIDPKWCPYAIAAILDKNHITTLHGDDPCLLPKACKNDAELSGARAAAKRDGAVMVQFLAWLDEVAPQGGLTEIDVVTQLEGLRRSTNVLRDISFETICGVGPHAALPHYRVSDDSNAAVVLDDLLLVDSGGQYVDGTTDITRTIIVGDPKSDHIKCYTLVLQGVIALSRARFPKGVTGAHLDTLARFPLWTAGMDFDHGTGHGIGSYLSVHEGPQSISRRSDVVLKEGMIVSNEPGYYREGDFGIRTENLIAVITAPKIAGADKREMLAFETLTYVPFDRRLIDVNRLSPQEILWIDQYHADTLALLGDCVEWNVKKWLSAACAPLARH